MSSEPKYGSCTEFGDWQTDVGRPCPARLQRRSSQRLVVEGGANGQESAQGDSHLLYDAFGLAFLRPGSVNFLSRSAFSRFGNG